MAKAAEEVRVNRLRFIELPDRGAQSFCALVDKGLSQTPKSLPTRFFYDMEGSDLFERITELPEYTLTRCEAEILERHAADIVLACEKPESMIEFGSGSSKKTRLLIEAALAAGAGLMYVPIDISAEYLRETSERLLESYPELSITAFAAEYFTAAERLPQFEGPRLILFLGSNIGNLTRDESVQLLRSVAKDMKPSDRFLVGIDLVKDPEVIERAYNDPQGLTARFNKNLLARINREMDAHFDLDAFEHHAPYLAAQQRVEMRLYSRRPQRVRVEALGKEFSFDEDEYIHTEWSHKYTDDSFEALAREAGLGVKQTWKDGPEWFALKLLAREVTSA